MFKNVVIPFDIRFIPRLALRAAAALAHGGAKLSLLYITDVAAEFSVGFTPISEDAFKRHDAHVNQQTDNVLAVLAEFGATASTYRIHGSPVHTAINRVAKALDADAILMGTHGRRGLARVWSGSVTESVMREADVPVIVVRESSRTPFVPLFLEQHGRI